MNSGILKRDEKENHNKSLISGSSKEKKDDENELEKEISMGNISGIQDQSFKDESKHG